MSFEGSYQKLCKKGHLTEVDVYGQIYEFCPICHQEFVWENLVDETNGSYDDEGNRIDGYVELKLQKETTCKHCNSILERTYKIPKSKRSRR
jgi:RNA polymerase subunit RPABC4/transcription elongation factor Spt4